eukprot:14712435-Alexandrium_andersonii.AAC.1
MPARIHTRARSHEEACPRARFALDRVGASDERVGTWAPRAGYKAEVHARPTSRAVSYTHLTLPTICSV